jgi:excisionase family DNA binding protein
MPRTKKQSATQPENGTPTKSAEVLTLTEAAAYLRVGEVDVLRLIREQALPARQIGSDWRFLKPALQDWLRTGPATKGLLQLAGAIKDDANVKEMLTEIYQARGRPEAEGSGCTSSTRTR